MTHAMRTPINAYEVLEMAQRIERNGVSFYRAAAEQTTSRDVRQVLLNLAADEESHEKTFAEMAEQLPYEERKVTLFEPITEIAELISTLADSRVFNLKEEFNPQMIAKATITDILKTAIGKEKDSIVFYLTLRDFVSAQAGRDKVEAILREEIEHVNILGSRLEQCK